MYWYKVSVYNHESFIGSFYTTISKNQDVEKEIDEKYGQNRWTTYYIE